MSGLETAIRNALDRSDRGDREARARIYQSARQALDAGLRKQGISDRLIVMEQHERLEAKIHEIEMEEVRRLSGPAPDPIVEADPVHDTAATPVAPPSVDMRAERAAPAPQVVVEPPVPPPPAVTAYPAMPAGMIAPSAQSAAGIQGPGDFAVTRDGRVEAAPDRLNPTGRAGKPAKPVKAAKGGKGQGRASGTMLDTPPERAAKPRRRRSFVSHLMTWFLTLAIVGGACFWFYQSGMVQSVVEEAVTAAEGIGRGTQAGGRGTVVFDPRRGFSDDWVEIFTPSRVAELKPGPQVRVEAVSASQGQAVRILSAVSSEGGDVAVDMPAEVLREMAGKNSTVALTLQSGEDRSAQLSVRCDFGSLGNCRRHRFTATQEKIEALFQVTFDRSVAPDSSGRLVFNSGIDGADRPVLLYSVRILPGQ